MKKMLIIALLLLMPTPVYAQYSPQGYDQGAGDSYNRQNQQIDEERQLRNQQADEESKLHDMQDKIDWERRQTEDAQHQLDRQRNGAFAGQN